MTPDHPAQVSEAADRVMAEMSLEADQPVEVDPHPDRTREFRTPGFSRMRTDWHSPDAQVIQQVMGIIANRILTNFASAYQIMNELYDIVREPEVDTKTGEVLTDHNGWAIWKRDSYGGYVENFSHLTVRQKEDFLLRITLGNFEWSQKAAEGWAEAMFSKAQWEESMAVAFTSVEGRATIEDRTQSARLGSRDERYYAVFLSAYSRKADGIVRSMEGIGQRLKDLLA